MGEVPCMAHSLARPAYLVVGSLWQCLQSDRNDSKFPRKRFNKEFNSSNVVWRSSELHNLSHSWNALLLGDNLGNFRRRPIGDGQESRLPEQALSSTNLQNGNHFVITYLKHLEGGSALGNPHPSRARSSGWSRLQPQLRSS